MTYLQSAAKFGFPLRKILPDQLREKCLNQEWSSIEIKSGLKEGRGVFANKCIKKNRPIVQLWWSSCIPLLRREISSSR